MVGERIYRNRKFQRPFSSTQPMHLTLRTDVGNLRRADVLPWLNKYLPETARHHKIRLFHFAIVGNHIHLALLATSREGLNRFLRIIGGVIARRVLGAEKGRAKGVKFWAGRPYSRVLTWGRELENVIAYIERNAMEASGKLTYVKRKTPLVPPIKEAITQNLVLARFETLSRQMPMQI